MTLPSTSDLRVRTIGLGEACRELDPREVGSKAARLQSLAALGLRVPPAFVVTTDCCRQWLAGAGSLPEDLRASIRAGITGLEQATGRGFGGHHPLLVSVRSSPPVSMPGMLDTVLNVGLTEPAVHGLVRVTGNPWLAWDSYRRFAQSYGEIVLGGPSAPFDHVVAAQLESAGVTSLQDLDPLAVRDLARATAALAQALAGRPIPSDPVAQVEESIAAVFRSWDSPRARDYRRLMGVADDTGTAVIVQAMVFGNGGGLSGSGVGFTRDPSTGANTLYIDFLFNAQGEDVVSGRRAVTGVSRLAATLPGVHAELVEAKDRLEHGLHDMQDVEFTVEDGRLYFLQTRSGKRTPWAALQIAVDLVRSGVTTPAEALERLRPYDLSAITRATLEGTAQAVRLSTGVGAGLGVVSGAAVFDAERAHVRATEGRVILVRPDIATSDVTGIADAAGILTAVGGRTSHAAVVARQLGKVCVVGCNDLAVDAARGRALIGTETIREGDLLTLDGETGAVYRGVLAVTHERPEAALEEVQHWERAGATPVSPR